VVRLNDDLCDEIRNANQLPLPPRMLAWSSKLFVFLKTPPNSKIIKRKHKNYKRETFQNIRI
jgi:hypothetical protein